MTTPVENILEKLENLREEFEAERNEYSNPGLVGDPYLYGQWSGKEEAYEDAYHRLNEIIIAIEEGKI